MENDSKRSDREGSETLMKYWICPICACVNVQSVTECDGCGAPADVILLLQTLQWVEFYSIDELDKWISTMQRMMGSKVWRKKEAK
jgi:hypothetical protein